MSVRIDQEVIEVLSQGLTSTSSHTRVNQVVMMDWMAFTLYPIPANPDVQPGTIPSVDIYATNSLTSSGYQCWFEAGPHPQLINTSLVLGNPNVPRVLATGNPVATRADGALWDMVAGEYVSIDKTTIGTGVNSKNGQ